MLKIFLIGYGKMGQRIAELAPSLNVQITGYSSSKSTGFLDNQAFQEADGVIEFTRPSAVRSNLQEVCKSGKWMVSGTTGWEEDIPAFQQEVIAAKNKLFYASNFSTGAFITFELNKVLARWMNQLPSYRTSMTEVHHTQKLDKPSGTAKTLAQGIIGNHDQYENWSLEKPDQESSIHIECLRQEGVKGIHEVRYHNSVDEIMLRHEAYSRDGFALGALEAALWLSQQPSGCYGMADMIQL